MSQLVEQLRGFVTHWEGTVAQVAERLVLAQTCLQRAREVLAEAEEKELVNE